MKKIIKKIKKIFSNKLVAIGIIPFLLFTFWFMSSLFLNSKISFSVLLYKEPQNEIKQISSEKLLKGGKISGEFRAKENYLGIVMVRFNKYTKHDFTSEDILRFKLREKGTKSWYYLNDYRTGQLENNLLFPFGFPVIQDSKNRIYQFEIESILGNNINAVEVNKKNLAWLTGYQFPIIETFSDNRAAFNFLIKKTITSFTDIDFLLSSSLYMVPLIIYILVYILSPWLRRVKNFRYISPGILLTLIILDVFFVTEVYLGILTSLILGWSYCIAKFRLESKISFSIAFGFIILWTILIMLKITEFQNKINIWVYAFLVIGICHAIFEERRSIKNK